MAKISFTKNLAVRGVARVSMSDVELAVSGGIAHLMNVLKDVGFENAVFWASKSDLPVDWGTRGFDATAEFPDRIVWFQVLPTFTGEVNDDLGLEKVTVLDVWPYAPAATAPAVPATGTPAALPKPASPPKDTSALLLGGVAVGGFVLLLALAYYNAQQQEGAL